jgi:diguanylate cyclase
MSRQTSTRVPKSTGLAPAALAMLGRPNGDSRPDPRDTGPDPGTASAARALRTAVDAVAGIGTRVVPTGDPKADVAIEQWDDLFSAVKATLRLTVDERSAESTEVQTRRTTGQIQVGVQECVAALDQLHATLTNELGRRHQLELQVFNAQSALAQALAELAGTQAGEKRARHQALHDSLTSLPNRCFFLERLGQELARAEAQHRALAVLYFDLDGFKQINDEHGHDAGDQLLRIVAARLLRAVRAEDMVSRLGGDEFGCLLAELPGREQVGRLAGKLLDVVSAPLKIGAVGLTVSTSIGIAIWPDDGATADLLLKHADAAMYRAKRHKSGYAFFDQSNDV